MAVLYLCLGYLYHKYEKNIQNYKYALFFISFMERTSTFEKNTEEEDSDLRKNIDDLVKQIFENINKVLMVIVKDNPLTASLLFSRIAISLLIRNSFNELGFYRNILKMMQIVNTTQ